MSVLRKDMQKGSSCARYSLRTRAEASENVGWALLYHRCASRPPSSGRLWLRARPTLFAHKWKSQAQYSGVVIYRSGEVSRYLLTSPIVQAA
jgi:hypothetical protein